jgi:hypothetical protein
VTLSILYSLEVCEAEKKIGVNVQVGFRGPEQLGEISANCLTSEGTYAVASPVTTPTPLADNNVADNNDKSVADIERD